MSASRSAAVSAAGTVGHVARATRRHPRRLVLVAALVAVLAGLAWVVTARFGGEAAAPAREAAGAPTLSELLPVLTRSGLAPHGVAVDVTYAPPLFFAVTNQEAPPGTRERPTLVFFVRESVHAGALPAEPPAVFLRIDGAGRLEPYETAAVSGDIHHRITRLHFAAASEGGLTVDDGDRHTLALVVPMEDGTVSSGNTLTWKLPLALPQASAADRGQESGETVLAPGALQLSSLTRPLRKERSGVRYGGVQGIDVEAIYATPEYFEAALPQDAAARYAPERFFVFVVSETSHGADLPGASLRPELRVGGREYAPDLLERKISSPHHRVAIVRFPADTARAERPGTMELLLADGSSLEWTLPIRYQSGGAGSPFGLPWASILALLGGFLGSMWPCLFQLTVFFMPTLAGISMQEASGAGGISPRRQVAKAALFFVSGFTLVYTAAGALIGFAAGRLQDTSAFETWQRYIGVGAGVLILVLALRVAVRGRAPLVCKMPLLPRMSKSTGATPTEMMLAGLAFATGCMTCFGSALVVGMVVYVGLSNSALYGAFILFLFSLGMGIPLGIAAMAMSRVLPLMSRLEKAMPVMALASALLMVGFAALLISGNYMALTEWIYRLR